MNMFQPATKKKLKARIALDGPAGSGKTYTALRIAFALAQGGKVGVIDTEHRSASKYIGESPDGIPWQFDVCELEHYAPSTYTQVVRAAGSEYAVLIVDSLSHAWEGVGGALDMVDKAKASNSFTAWKDVTPQHRSMVETLLACPCHLIVTMRSKMAYVLEETTNKSGNKVMVPQKVGMQPVQRAGMEYEFDIVADLDLNHTLTVSKTRCSAIDGQKVSQPGPAFVQPVLAWLESGVETPAVNSHQAVLLSAPEKEEDIYTANLNDCCGEEWAAAIKDRASAAQVPVETIKEILTAHGVNRIADLQLKDAQTLMSKLDRKLQEADVPF